MNLITIPRGILMVVLVLTMLLGTVACDGDDDDFEEEANLEPTPTVSPQASAVAEEEGGLAPTPTASSPASTTAIDATGLPMITTQADILFTDLAAGGQVIFEVDVENEYGNEPRGSIEPYLEGQTLEESVRANLRILAERGYAEIEVYVMEGFGALYLTSQVLEPLRHEGFDYDSQSRNGELIVDEEEARQRYYSVGDVLPMVVGEAHAQGMKVTGLIESLAHIINRASDSGIGSGGALLISGNLPAPSVEQVLAFVDEVLATGVDAISAEAFPIEYGKAIADHLASRGVPFLRTGADLGTVWMGYYYSFYPDAAVVEDVYSYLYTADSLLGTTDGTIFARARALSPKPETGLVVGAYNPLPCDTNLSLADLYSLQRPGPDALPIDQDVPTLADGTVVENCATGPWRNLILLAVRRQGVDRILLTADMEPSVTASSEPGILQDILERIAAHPAPDTLLPVANIIFDLPQFTDEDGYTTEEFFDSVSVSTVGVVDDALQAAGYQTVLTYNHPWDGGTTALTYIITAGGNEETGDGIGMGPPFWSNAQGLEPSILELLDPAKYQSPVFIHPIFGVAGHGNWQSIREQFGLPDRFPYFNSTLSQYEEYHTSLLTSFSITAEGDIGDIAQDRPITPETGAVLGHTMHLTPYTDFYRLGQVANFANGDELMEANIFAEGPMLVPDSSGVAQERTAPYMVTDGQGRFLWLINQMHHEATTYIVGQAIAQATGTPAVLAAPASAHVWSGTQTFALAYANTEVTLRLPFDPGQFIDVTVYDIRSNPVREERGVPYQEPFTATLDKYSLLVVEPAR